MTKIYDNKIPKTPILTVIVFSACLLLGFLYIYFLSNTVVGVVLNKESRQNIQALKAEIARLEADYIEQKHKLSLDVASHKGYQAITEKVFIDKRDSVVVFDRR